jgi:hypothetical protein
MCHVCIITYKPHTPAERFITLFIFHSLLFSVKYAGVYLHATMRQGEDKNY